MKSETVLITDRDEIRKLSGKSKESVFRDIKIIKEWLETQKHLPEIPSDNLIEFFLNNCKFSIEKTKQNLDMYYTLRNLIPDMYQNVNPSTPNLEEVYKKVYMIPLPQLTPSKERIILFRYKDVDDIVDIRKIYAHYLNNIYEIRAQEDLTMGDVVLVDLEHISFAMAAKNTPVILKQVALAMEKVHSLRMKGIFIFNCPNYLTNFLNLFKSFLSSKLSERFHVYPTIESIGKHFPIDILPSDLGGKEKSLDELEAMWKVKFMEFKDRFDELEKMKVNEKLRPEKLKNDELLGYYGNFKKIDTD
ncbi:uncharacterized protein LOC130900934 [Diorhabda carinulata]|uniref:uncharacterized protein LOC130900934 n=1 Tax=Diorhabda carinulata TaxID=1163345 RepID=UPI0025A0E319|nr:uncharacterized protein LOC130900934 [Diorhabda carinulata]